MCTRSGIVNRCGRHDCTFNCALLVASGVTNVDPMRTCWVFPSLLPAAVRLALKVFRMEKGRGTRQALREHSLHGKSHRMSVCRIHNSKRFPLWDELRGLSVRHTGSHGGLRAWGLCVFDANDNIGRNAFHALLVASWILCAVRSAVVSAFGRKTRKLCAVQLMTFYQSTSVPFGVQRKGPDNM
eukprot:6490233-Amphidinium_carterae.3